MIKIYLIGGRRNVHSMTKALYKSKFSIEEAEKILNVVNNTNADELASRFAISKLRAKKLEFSREQSGKNIEDVDEIPKIGGFGESVFNQFCNSILNEGTENGSKKKSKNRSYTLPPIPSHLIQQINSFTAIHCGTTALAWSTFEVAPNQTTKLIHWDWKLLPEERLDVYKLAAFMKNTWENVPKSDFYVFENPTAPTIGSSPKANLNVQISQMVGMSSVIAARNNTLDINTECVAENEMMNIAYLRRFLFARLFKIYVGTERVSTIDCVEDLIRKTNCSSIIDQNVQSIIDVDLSLKSVYTKSKSRAKDVLGCSFLLGTAFLRLGLLKCRKSIKLVGK